jgi:hypothetical protein
VVDQQPVGSPPVQKPPLDPDVADTAPSGAVMTACDEEHLVTYLSMLDADAEGADWRGRRGLRIPRPRSERQPGTSHRCTELSCSPLNVVKTVRIDPPRPLTFSICTALVLVRGIGALDSIGDVAFLPHGITFCSDGASPCAIPAGISGTGKIDPVQTVR